MCLTRPKNQRRVYFENLLFYMEKSSNFKKTLTVSAGFLALIVSINNVVCG